MYGSLGLGVVLLGMGLEGFGLEPRMQVWARDLQFRGGGSQQLFKSRIELQGWGSRVQGFRRLGV